MSKWKNGIDAGSIFYSYALDCKYWFIISIIAKCEVGEIEKLTLTIFNK